MNNAGAAHASDVMEEDMNGDLEGFIVNDDAVEYDEESDEEMVNSDDDEVSENERGGIDGVDSARPKTHIRGQQHGAFT